jgi:uncharacterized protein (DUF697 family)
MQKTPTLHSQTEFFQKITQAEEIIAKHVSSALWIGLLPVPVLDFVAVTWIQLKMTEQLADLHDIPFTKNNVKNVLLSLIGGGFSASVSYRLLLSASKIFGPGLPLVSVVGSGVTAGATTYAVGKVFSRHFAEGGTFLSFDPKKASAFYQQMFEEGRSVAADMKEGCCCRPAEKPAASQEHAEQTAQPAVIDEETVDHIEAVPEATVPVEDAAEPEVSVKNAAGQHAEPTAASGSITIVDIFLIVPQQTQLLAFT